MYTLYNACVFYFEFDSANNSNIVVATIRTLCEDEKRVQVSRVLRGLGVRHVSGIVYRSLFAART